MPPKKKTYLQWLDEKEKPIQKALHTPVFKRLNRRVSAGSATAGGGLITTKVPNTVIMPPKKKTYLQWLDEKEKPIQKALHTPVRKTLNRRVSAGIATAGGGLISTKVPFVTQLGYCMQVPALLWDIYDFAKNPTIANGAEFIPDIINKIGQIRGKNWDDAMRYAGMSNDAVEAITGRSGVAWVDYLVNRKTKRKQLSEQVPINLINKNASKEGKDR